MNMKFVRCRQQLMQQRLASTMSSMRCLQQLKHLVVSAFSMLPSMVVLEFSVMIWDITPSWVQVHTHVYCTGFVMTEMFVAVNWFLLMLVLKWNLSTQQISPARCPSMGSSLQLNARSICWSMSHSLQALQQLSLEYFSLKLTKPAKRYWQRVWQIWGC